MGYIGNLIPGIGGSFTGSMMNPMEFDGGEGTDDSFGSKKDTVGEVRRIESNDSKLVFRSPEGAR